MLVPLGKGETLCVPMGQDMNNMIDHLDQEQVVRLDELQKSIANMIRSRREEWDGREFYVILSTNNVKRFSIIK